jgi:hypothetical protein
VRLTAKAVGDVLETTLGYRVEMKPYGFDLTAHHELNPRRARLRSGSGIAGNSDVWWLVALAVGQVIVGDIRTKPKLVRAVLEFMAGPPPAPLSGYTTPRAKRVIVPRTGDSRFVWHRRLKKRPTPVALIPFGAALR